jgi:lysyl-tRNA synthetase, class II
LVLCISFKLCGDLDTNPLQLLLKKDEVGDSQIEQFQELVDFGDFIGVKGRMYTTLAGEKTLRIKHYVLLGTALRSLTEKWHGLANIDVRYRKRYLDLMMTSETQSRVTYGSKIVRAIRRFFEDHDFIKVETPILLR